MKTKLLLILGISMFLIGLASLYFAIDGGSIYILDTLDSYAIGVSFLIFSIPITLLGEASK